jgi:type II secretory ATPase GspE/PulE/Tfp pilus assembly ATPase PilB-like protein
MPDLLAAAVEYGGYISIVKLLVFLILFFLWLPLITWVYRDAEALEANKELWTGLVLGAGGVGVAIWLVVPFFLIGLPVYIIGVGATSLAYVRHRNTRVMDFDRVLTAEHIKSLFAREDVKLQGLKSFQFITANKNEVPVPQPRTPDFFGYKIAYDLLMDVKYRRASSVVFAPTPQEYNVTYFVDGAPLKQPGMPREQMTYLIRFIKHLADLDVKEKRKPQKGNFKVSQEKEYVDWELTTAGSTAGEQVLLKKVEQHIITRLTQIGLMPRQLEQLNAFRQLKEGLFIVSGPRKSGVTTTFYAMLRNHDAFLNSINTLERERSAELPNITQSVFKLTDSGTATYANKLKEMIRMGPDIVGVAGCQDTESARAACAGAKDGKIVYITLAADSVIQALGRWLKLVGDRNAAADTLLGISNQRLLRMLCPQCKQAYAPNKELFRKFNITAESTKVLYRAGKVEYDKHGKPMTCEYCQGTGYVSRTGVFEMIIMTDELRNILRQTKSLPEIASQFRRARMLYLQEQALRKVIAGTTDINEMIRVLSASKPQKPRKSGG